MEIQNQVSRILRDNLARLRDVLDEAVSQGVGSLGQVADRVCEAFDFRDGRGRWQRANCCRALSDLQAAGHVSLPASQAARGVGGRARVLPHPMAPAVDVPGTVGKVVGLTLALVETDAQRQVWNTLMAYEHPRGAGPFVGPQLRYLVGSAHGWLGGVGFAASARRLRSRDAWVGWDDTGRRAHLHRVLGLCRLLVRPGIVCRNLASHVLGRVVRAVGDDCEGLYGYRPWLLETFVDETEQTGASVRAANWVRVGETCGRGRQDRRHAAPETRKAVYMYALEPAGRTRLAVPAPVVAPLAVGDGLDAAVWADHEFGGARLGDARLSARLVQSAQQMAESPMRAITGARPRRPRDGQGPLPADRPARRQCGDGRQHPRAASRADAAPDAGARHGAVHPGRHPVELHPARADARAGGHRLEPDRGGGARPGVAHDLGRQSRRGGVGCAAGRLRRARVPQLRGGRRADPKAAREAQVVPLDRGAARLRAGSRAIVRDPRGVRDGPRGRFPRPVRRTPRGCPAGRPAGPRQGRPRPRQGKDARRADGLTPSVRYGAQRAGPRRRQGRGAAAERAREGQQTGPQGPPGGAGRRRDAALPAGAGCPAPATSRSHCGSSTCARNNRRPRPSRWSGSC